MKLIVTKQYRNFARSIGMYMENILEAAGLPDSLDDEEIPVNDEEFVRFMHALDDSLSDEQILAVSEIGNVNQFIPTLYASLCAKDGLEAVDRFSEYFSVIVPVEVMREESENGLRVSFRMRNNYHPLAREIVISMQIFLLSLIRMGTGEDVVPLQVGSDFEYGDFFDGYLGVRSIRTRENVIEFSEEDLRVPFLTENELMWEIIRPELASLLRDAKDEERFSSRVYNSLLVAIPAGRFGVEDIAGMLCMSTRTLQRELKKEGTSYREVLVTVQRTMAEDYLRNAELSVEQIAHLVGFNDASSFARAFKSWTGRTSSSYR